MKQMTTVYLDDRHIKFFDKHREDSMSHVIRVLLTKYIDNYEKKYQKSKISENLKNSENFSRNNIQSTKEVK